MPRLAAFHGVVIYMYIRDHGTAHLSYNQNLWIDHPFEDAAYLPR